MGVLFVIGGISGTMVLRGTGSSLALAAVGVVMVIIGVIQAASGGGGSAQSEYAAMQEADAERDREQMEEYERTKARMAKALAEQPIPEEVNPLIKQTPGAQKQIDELIQRTKGHLDTAQLRSLVTETAQRLHDEHEQSQG